MTGNSASLNPPHMPFSRGGAAAHAIKGTPRRIRRPSLVPAWLILIGIILPAEIQISIGGSKFTAGRIGIMLLLVPALVTLFGGRRRLLPSDLVALALAIWMVVAAIFAGASESFTSAVAEAIEFVGGYLVARTFFVEAMTVEGFVRVLKLLVLAIVGAALLDALSGRWLIHDTIASFLGAPLFDATFRGNMIRAKATFDHPILFGTFCSLAAAILFYAESDPLKRLFWVGVCFVGCFLSQSSAAMMGFVIITATYTYDHMLRQYSWRWTLLWTTIAICTVIIFAVARHPIGWVISHLTLDPQSGYYRILIWDSAMAQISQQPIFGAGFSLFNDDILDHTVDSVWLVVALRFGVPMVVLMILLTVSVVLPVNRRIARQPSYLSRMSTAFTLVLVVFMFTGITVHFWNYMWIFWGVCIGMRAALREQAMRRIRSGY
ncbi:O-antigen ligase family protein [Afipia sp. Root123D2]|uniref:O-antigen ligase family protein n=1 Tax=Afipia sp. Root123D2 TaxID=1736436 RepID=UPI0006F5A5D3|nr:O-antigen ligase family protein [Afipia sp. Root123D2]